MCNLAGFFFFFFTGLDLIVFHGDCRLSVSCGSALRWNNMRDLLGWKKKHTHIHTKQNKKTNVLSVCLFSERFSYSTQGCFLCQRCLLYNTPEVLQAAEKELREYRHRLRPLYLFCSNSLRLSLEKVRLLPCVLRLLPAISSLLISTLPVHSPAFFSKTYPEFFLC